MPFKFFSKEGFERVTALANQDVELDYVQRTSTVLITPTTEGTATTVLSGNSFTADGLTKVKIEFFIPSADVAATNVSYIYLVFLRNAIVVGQGRVRVGQGGGTDIEAGSKTIIFEETPPAGSTAYTVKAYVNSNQANINAGPGGAGQLLPAFLRVTRVTQQVTTFPEAVFDVDNGDVPVWDAASSSWQGKSRELAYAEKTTGVGITSSDEANPTNVLSAPSVTFDGVTPVLIEFWSPSIGVAAGVGLLLNLWEDTTNLGRLGEWGSEVSSGPKYLSRHLTPAAGAKVYKVAGFRGNPGTPSVGAGAGGSGNLMPMFLRISRA